MKLTNKKLEELIMEELSLLTEIKELSDITFPIPKDALKTPKGRKQYLGSDTGFSKKKWAKASEEGEIDKAKFVKIINSMDGHIKTQMKNHKTANTWVALLDPNAAASFIGGNTPTTSTAQAQKPTTVVSATPQVQQPITFDLQTFNKLIDTVLEAAKGTDQSVVDTAKKNLRDYFQKFSKDAENAADKDKQLVSKVGAAINAKAKFDFAQLQAEIDKVTAATDLQGLTQAETDLTSYYTKNKADIDANQTEKTKYEAAILKISDKKQLFQDATFKKLIDDAVTIAADPNSGVSKLKTTKADLENKKNTDPAFGTYVTKNKQNYDAAIKDLNNAILTPIGNLKIDSTPDLYMKTKFKDSSGNYTDMPILGELSEAMGFTASSFKERIIKLDQIFNNPASALSQIGAFVQDTDNDGTKDDDVLSTLLSATFVVEMLDQIKGEDVTSAGFYLESWVLSLISGGKKYHGDAMDLEIPVSGGTEFWSCKFYLNADLHVKQASLYNSGFGTGTGELPYNILYISKNIQNQTQKPTKLDFYHISSKDPSYNLEPTVKNMKTSLDHQGNLIEEQDLVPFATIDLTKFNAFEASINQLAPAANTKEELYQQLYESSIGLRNNVNLLKAHLANYFQTFDKNSADNVVKAGENVNYYLTSLDTKKTTFDPTAGGQQISPQDQEVLLKNKDYLEDPEGRLPEITISQDYRRLPPRKPVRGQLGRLKKADIQGFKHDVIDKISGNISGNTPEDRIRNFCKWFSNVYNNTLNAMSDTQNQPLMQSFSQVIAAENLFRIMNSIKVVSESGSNIAGFTIENWFSSILGGFTGGDNQQLEDIMFFQFDNSGNLQNMTGYSSKLYQALGNTSNAQTIKETKDKIRNRIVSMLKFDNSSYKLYPILSQNWNINTLKPQTVTNWQSINNNASDASEGGSMDNLLKFFLKKANEILGSTDQKFEPKHLEAIANAPNFSDIIDTSLSVATPKEMDKGTNVRGERYFGVGNQFQQNTELKFRGVSILVDYDYVNKIKIAKKLLFYLSPEFTFTYQEFGEGFNRRGYGEGGAKTFGVEKFTGWYKGLPTGWRQGDKKGWFELMSNIQGEHELLGVINVDPTSIDKFLDNLELKMNGVKNNFIDIFRTFNEFKYTIFSFFNEPAIKYLDMSVANFADFKIKMNAAFTAAGFTSAQISESMEALDKLILEILQESKKRKK